MQLASDILLVLGALGATLYCIVLSRRLRRFTDLETGMGGAIAVLSAQVDDMTKSLEAARTMAQSSAVSLDGLTERAEAASRRLELMMASLHDLPADAPPPPKAARTTAASPAQDSTVFLSRRRPVAAGAR